MARNGVGKLQLLIAVMVMFVFVADVAQVQAGIDKECYQKCSSSCIGRFRAPCCQLCLRKCKIPLSIEDAPDDCTLGCAKFKCSNFSSTDFDQVEGCVDSCTEICKKKN